MACPPTHEFSPSEQIDCDNSVPFSNGVDRPVAPLVWLVRLETAPEFIELAQSPPE